VKRGEVHLRLGLLRQALADFQSAARLPSDDRETLAYARAAILSVRKDLSRSVERNAPSPRELWRRIRRTAPASIRRHAMSGIAPVGE
jgi:hypothetical protein